MPAGVTTAALTDVIIGTMAIFTDTKIKKIQIFDLDFLTVAGSVLTSPLSFDVWLPLLFIKCHCPYPPPTKKEKKTYSAIYGLFANGKKLKIKKRARTK